MAEHFLYGESDLDLDALTIYSDDTLLVVNKPPGLPSVSSKNPKFKTNLYDYLIKQCGDIYLIHRLDVATSGVIIFARTKAAQRHLSIQFEKRIPKKSYVAIVHGHLSHEAGTIDLPLSVDWPNRPLQMLNFETGKQAVTHYRRLALLPNHQTLIQFFPYTGRSHQLRIHAQLLGYPMVGCNFYGIDNDPAPRLMLHAWQLVLRHPDSQEFMRFVQSPELDCDFDFEEKASLLLDLPSS
ncbi:RluA family pseudouridine synthase [Pleionea sp. CnH1-48]|uniref:RluA family pseudouridine synthase n=1 Tax=Pleionea sp. CnH1-48 TaxID=2954494 RepID=UPI002096EE2C|nr:RluA family pseudouridine synthase [Pleionea sp. CnH1-48]MCO7226934.1 RluA family pseudouridine synthase [Pleionea sp. CnH1-48]